MIFYVQISIIKIIIINHEYCINKIYRLFALLLLIISLVNILINNLCWKSLNNILYNLYIGHHFLNVSI